jgi:hypothetical protein
LTREDTHLNRRHGRRATLAGILACAALLVLPAGNAMAGSGGVSTDGGGSQTTAGKDAKLRNGIAIAPRSAPARVKRAIDAANEIVKGKDYCLGGGHARWRSRCYDCSGAVSYALGKYGSRQVDAPMPSGSYASYGKRGKGNWITWYANSGHMFVVIAGLRLDTAQTSGKGPGWSENVRAGFVNVSKSAARHKGKI